MTSSTDSTRDLMIAAILTIFFGFASFYVDFPQGSTAGTAPFQIGTTAQMLLIVCFGAMMVAWYFWRRHKDAMRSLRRANEALTAFQATGAAQIDEGRFQHLLERAQDTIAIADAEKEIRRQATRAEALVQISSRLNAQIDLERTLEVVCEETASALEVPIVTVSLFDEAKQALVVRYTYGVEAELAQQMQPVHLETLRKYATDNALVVTPDVQALPDLPNAALYARMQLRTTVNAMLMRHSQLIGRLNIATVGEVRTFTADEFSLLQGLAAQATQAIINARLYTQARRRLDRLQSLHVIHRAITALQPLSVTLDAVVTQIATQLGVDAVAVLTFDPNSQTLQYAAGTGFHGAATHHTRIQLGEGYAGRSAQERRILHIVQPVTDQESAPVELMDSEGFASYYSVPLVAQEKLIGILEVYHRTDLAPSKEWLVFLEALALQMAIAINHAMLFERTREQAEQLQQIVDVVPEGMLVLDEHYHLLLANPAAQACMARNNKSISIGEPLTHLCHYPISEFTQRTARSPLWQEVHVESPPQIYEASAQPLQVNDAATGWVLLLRDVTDARKRQASLQRQERLATVGQFAAGIAHDFNNMLSPILLHTEYNLAQTPPGTRLHRNLEQVLQASTRARDLVAQILAFGSRDPNQQPQATRLHAIVREALDLLHASLPSNITVERDIQDSAGTVWIDPIQMHQIVMNLCTNAAHAMRATGGRLSVCLENAMVDSALTDAHPHLRPGIYVRLTVRDTGHGIDSETQAHIFEPFFTTKELGEGTGMGLAMVYGIVATYRGDIVVESNPDAGASFAIYLPLYSGRPADLDDSRPESLLGARKAPAREENIDPSPSLERANEKRAPVQAMRDAHHILVVDDEEAIVQATQEILEIQGYAVTTTSSSAAALDLLREQPDEYDLLLTDLNMPEISGITLVETVRALRADLPVILTSGYHDHIPQRKITELRVQLLSKPFSIDTLRQVLRQALAA